ncbi:MAG: sigma-54-dependent Fis family transcriptional regulator [Candidatus Latescibacteria bacterium]|nr:sigma-54-dependent Fis family transcriptional regulator [Candidatus Latescibacterota bacterium]
MARQRKDQADTSLERLRQAVRDRGLIAELSGPEPREHSLLVSNRLAQTTLRYLLDVDAQTGQALAAELRALSTPEAYELLVQDRCYTFFHVVQFLYEFAKCHSALPERRYFCAGMGRGGGGLEVAPDREVISLVELMTSALPAQADSRTLSALMQVLVPLFLDRIFPAGLFALELEEGEDSLHIALRYADPARVRADLEPHGLGGDLGVFFFNSALHIQGVLQLGWQTLVEDGEQHVEMEGLIEGRGMEAQKLIEAQCRCAWVARWQSPLRLRQLPDDEAVLAQTRIICEALQRKDAQYYQERIKGLELRIQALEERDQYHGLIGSSPPMQLLYRQIQQVAGTDLTVLVRGESGTGKELVARAIHHSSARRDQPFVAVNCAALSETLLESELFGHEKGAFTGAVQARPGRFEMADGGTLFLDEIGDIPLSTQVKLLRVLETQLFERVGGMRSIHTDVRFIGATNRDLEALISEGKLREDFYFRIQVLPIHLPPLRQHWEDIPHLGQHFLRRISQRSGRRLEGFSRGALQRLLRHDWPGNIRELHHVIERAAVLYAEGPVLGESQIAQALGAPAQVRPTAGSVAPLHLNRRQEEVLRCIGSAPEGMVLEEVLAALPAANLRGGSSARTLQNDLGKLAGAGYLSWVKQGNARLYRVTPEGRQQLLT